MLLWGSHNSHPALDRRGIGTLPLLDYLVLALLLAFGIAGYQHVRAVREQLRASSGVLRVAAVCCSRAAQTTEGAR